MNCCGLLAELLVDAAEVAEQFGGALRVLRTKPQVRDLRVLVCYVGRRAVSLGCEFAQPLQLRLE